MLLWKQLPGSSYHSNRALGTNFLEFEGDRYAGIYQTRMSYREIWCSRMFWSFSSTDFKSYQYVPISRGFRNLRVIGILY